MFLCFWWNNRKSLLAEQLQWFTCKTIPVIYWNRSASISLFWFCFANVDFFSIHHHAEACTRVYHCAHYFTAVKTKQRPLQNNSNQSLDSTKRWNYWTCFGPKSRLIFNESLFGWMIVTQSNMLCDWQEQARSN